MEIVITVATILGGIAALWFFGDRILAWLRRRGQSSNSPDRPVILTSSKVMQLYKEFKKGTRTSGGNIDLIQRIAQGQTNIVRECLEEVSSDNHSYYSMAEIDASRLALDDIQQGVATTNLIERVKSRNPNRKLVKQYPSVSAVKIQLLAETVFWDRPTSETYKDAFRMLLEAAGGK